MALEKGSRKKYRSKFHPRIELTQVDPMTLLDGPINIRAAVAPRGG